MIHDAYQTAVFWIEHKYHAFKSYSGEVQCWILGAACLALLSALIGFSVRLFLDKDSNFEWCSLNQVREYCIHETEEAAIKAFEKTRMKFVRALV